MLAAARPLALLALATTLGACASVPAGGTLDEPPAIAVLTPRDAVPIRARDALGGAADQTAESARAELLAGLGADVAAALAHGGARVVPATADAPLALDTELVAYGDIRRSWLWVLGAQALVAGIGHGVVVAQATHDSTLAWEAGGFEFLLETVTWVGGALVGGRQIDPVVMRVRLLDARRGTTLRGWTREGLRPWRQWLRRRDLPPRAVRLRAVADKVFVKLAPRIVRAARGADRKR